MIRALRFLLMLVTASMGLRTLGAQVPPASQSPAPPRRKPSFWQRLLRISGIAANPSTLKGPQELKSGQIWLVELEHRQPRRLTMRAAFRSPVFVPGSGDILALEGADVVRLPAAGGEPHRLYTIGGITKLVGFGLDDPDAVLLLREGRAGGQSVGLLSVKTGRVVPTPYDPASSEDRRMLEHLHGWERTYGDTTVYVKRFTKESLAGVAEWTDVMLKAGTNQPINVSRCDGVDCGQPSLSTDGHLLVFIRAEEL